MAINEDMTPAFQQVSSRNHGPWVLVASYIFLICTILIIIARLIPRLRLSYKLSFSDSFIIASTLLALVQTILVTRAIETGLGRHKEDLTESSFESYSKYFYASNILLIASLACAKTSVLFLIVSIKPARKTLLATYGVMGVVGLWGVASIFVLAFQCALPRPWDSTGKCVSQHAMYIAIGIINIVTDVAIVILPFFLMRSVQVGWVKRWKVIGIFAIRIIVPVAIIIQLVSLNPYFNSTPLDKSWHSVAPTLWAEIMLNLSIMTASIPILNTFFANMRTGMMGFGTSEPLELSTSGKQNSYGNMYGSKTGPGIGSKIRGGLGMKSQVSRSGLSTIGTSNENEEEHDMEDLKYGYGQLTSTSGNNKSTVERSESVKGLTDNVIVQTVDYKVEYEDGTDRYRHHRPSPAHNHSRHSSPSEDDDILVREM